MNPIILPPDYPNLALPHIFLAGPIQGTWNWQKEAIKILQSSKLVFAIASPRKEYLNNTFDYNAQVDWESHYLKKAEKSGVILFWLAKEQEHFPERAYAQTSRFELAEWKVNYQQGNIKLVLGIEEGFSGARYIRRRFEQDCPKIQIQSTLEDTCQEALNFLS